MSNSPKNCCVRFRVVSEESLDSLGKIIGELSSEKQSGTRRADAEWLKLFTEQELKSFWWPTPAELKAWNDFWNSTPLPQRHGPEMPSPPWHFDSMIDAILNGEYKLLGLHRLSDSEAQLEFDPEAYPFGGTASLRALVRCFGHPVTGFNDGTGYVAGDPQSPLWNPISRTTTRWLQLIAALGRGWRRTRGPTSTTMS